MSEPVSVHELTKTFYDDSRGEVRAVDGINFDCHAGEIFGLLGANGAGKNDDAPHPGDHPQTHFRHGLVDGPRRIERAGSGAPESGL